MNMRVVTLAIFILFGSVLQNAVKAQRFDSLLLKLDQQYPQEKLYLHFDRSVYHPGETIWFKAYLLSSNFPSFLSSTFYAELIDEDGKILERRTAPMYLASSAAAFDLPVDFPGRMVYVRAYTRWMLNFDTSFLYTRAIPVVNPRAAATTAAKAKPTGVSLRFFPEGGDLIEGVQSRVAFKATDNTGLPARISGEVQDASAKKVADIIPQHNGMGVFTLIPEPGVRYKAVWKDSTGKINQTNLPVAKKDGVVVEARDSPAGIQFTLRRTNGPNAPKSVYVVAHMQQQLMYRARANMAEGTIISGFIPAESVPTGIVQLTVFSEDEVPLAERLIFANRQNYEFITDLNAPLKNVAKRGRNVIQIDVPDTITCNLSVSVTDADINPSSNIDSDIFSHILLSSDIKGYVHNPRYYFTTFNDSVAAHLDLVMMTNGWRRFRWDEVLAGKFPQLKYDPVDQLSLKGNITGLNKTQLARKEVTAILELSAGNQQFITIPVDPEGNFEIEGGLFFFDTAKVFYQFNNDQNKVLTSVATFNFNNGLLPQALKIPPDTTVMKYVKFPEPAIVQKNIDLAKKTITRIEDERRVQTLEAVEVTARARSKRDIMDDEYTSGLFRGGDGYTFITEDDPFALSAQTVFQYLQGKVPGLQINMAGGNASLSWRGGTPQVYFNEMMMQDVSAVQNTPMSDIAMVKVFRPPFMGGFGGGAGAIAVYTKKGGATQENVKGLSHVKLKGYDLPRDFYSPDYTRPDPEQQAEDIRATLYWNPYVVTGKDNRRIVLTFYNNDITKRFRVVVEGVDAEGKITRIEKVFE